MTKNGLIMSYVIHSAGFSVKAARPLSAMYGPMVGDRCFPSSHGISCKRQSESWEGMATLSPESGPN